MPTGDYYLQFLEEIDAGPYEVTQWEADFLETMLTQRPQHISEPRQESVRRMAKKYLNAEVA